MQVSLITCTYNSEKTIKDCCLSILSQSCKDLEHIIIDNHSNDKTLSIANEYKIKFQKILKQKSNGLYAALNEGLIAASGEIIGILHSDDQFIDNTIVENIRKIFLNEKIDILFSNLFYTKKNDTTKIVRKWRSNLANGIQSNLKIEKKINNGWMPPHTTIFFKKSLLNNIGLYNEKFKISSDYDFIIKLLRAKNIKIFFLDKYTIKMRAGGISNKSIANIFIKMIEDIKIMKKNEMNFFKTIILKNFSKISQFF